MRVTKLQSYTMINDEMYVCNYSPADKCTQCPNRKWCIFSKERIIVEQSIQILEDQLKTVEIAINNVTTEGKIHKENMNGELVEVSYNELLKRKDTIKADLEKQWEYVKMKYET